MKSSPDRDHGVVGYFGYGSLVCRSTHRTEIVAAVPARLAGWRRYWRPRPDMPGFASALLTVREEAGAGCDGLIVFDRAENLAAVDAREARYRRIELPRSSLTSAVNLPFDCPIHLYVANEEMPTSAAVQPILRSYLDAVMLGFLLEHGDEGLRRFIAETDGFETAIHDDRHAPIYPRAVDPGSHRSTLDKALDALSR